MEIKAFLRRIDWVKTLVPFAGMALLCALFILMPDASKDTLDRIGKFFRDDCGLYYGILGVGVFGLSMWVAFSKYGKVRLGNLEKPQYGDFMWGAMIFTSALAADILFYSLSEWAMYSADPHVHFFRTSSG